MSFKKIKTSGAAHVLRVEKSEGASFAALLREVDQVQQRLTTDTVQDAPG